MNNPTPTFRVVASSEPSDQSIAALARLLLAAVQDEPEPTEREREPKERPRHGGK